MSKRFTEWKLVERVSSKPTRVIIVGFFVVLALYNAESFGEAVGRALYYLTH